MAACHEPRNGYIYCAKHMEQSRVNRRRVRSMRMMLGFCTYCNAPALPGYVRCEKHTRMNKNANNAWREKRQKARGWKLVKVKV